MAGVDFRQAGSGQDGRARGGGGEGTDCAGVRSSAIWAGGFCPWRPLEVIVPWPARTFAPQSLHPV